MDANLKLLPYFNAKLIKTKKIKKMRKKIVIKKILECGVID